MCEPGASDGNAKQPRLLQTPEILQCNQPPMHSKTCVRDSTPGGASMRIGTHAAGAQTYVC